jgi:hypothetical protein
MKSATADFNFRVSNKKSATAESILTCAAGNPQLRIPFRKRKTGFPQLRIPCIRRTVIIIKVIPINETEKR